MNESNQKSLVESHITEICPSCGSSMDNNFGYVVWCTECNYNINPSFIEEKLNKLQKIYKNMGDKFGKATLNKILESKTIEPTFSWFRLGTFLVSTLIHGFSIFCFFTSIIMIFHWYEHFWYKVIGPILFGISLITRPKVYKLDKNEQILPREEFSSLYQLVDDIAIKSGIKKVNGIIINQDYNASITTIGIRRKKILYLGLPLLSVLTKEERIALLGHELGHSANHDLSRSFYVGTAIRTVLNWYLILAPERPLHHLGLFEEISSIIMKVVAIIPYGLFLLLVHLSWQDKQRAEYYADLFGAKVGGTEASISLNEKMLYSDIFHFIILKTAVGPYRTQFFSKLNEAIIEIPQNEVLRRTRIAEMELSRLDVTHPPISYRNKFLENNYIKEPLINSSERLNKKIDDELRTLENEVESKLVEGYLTSLEY